jgi:uncharacterized protein HemX
VPEQAYAPLGYRRPPCSARQPQRQSARPEAQDDEFPWHGGDTMTPNPILLFIWAALAIGFFGLLMYRGQLTRYEDDQLFLNEDTNKAEQEQQTEIVRRVKKIEPLVRIFGMYVYDAWQRIQ